MNFMNFMSFMGIMNFMNFVDFMNFMNSMESWLHPVFENILAYLPHAWKIGIMLDIASAMKRQARTTRYSGVLKRFHCVKTIVKRPRMERHEM